MQIYQANQNPCLPGQGGDSLAYWSPNKISTSPVSLSGSICPSGQSCTPNGDFSTSGDTYSATITYDGYTLTLSMHDVTAGGSCPGTSCFTHSWTGVYIPSIVGQTTAYVGFSSGVNIANLPALDVKTWSYTQNAPTGTPSYTAWNANSTYHVGTVSSASPVFSVAPGTYPGPQSVSITTSSTPHNYICYTLSSTVPTLFPAVDNNGGCSAGTLYTGPISISSTATLYAMAGSNNSAFGTAVNPTGLGPPSTLVAGTYSISGSQAAPPSFSPGAGTYTGTQSVTISDPTSGATIYYTTNGSTPTMSSTQYTGAIPVGSTETLEAIAVATGDSNSAVASAAYTMTSEAAVAKSTFSPAAGSYTSAESVAISDATSGATIYYTTNGKTPTTSSTKYTGPITVDSTETLQAIAVDTGDSNSAVASAAYTIASQSDTGTPQVISYPSGFEGDPSQLWLGNGAVYSGSSIELTNSKFNLANNVWYKTPVNVQAFTTTFTWTASCPAAIRTVEAAYCFAIADSAADSIVNCGIAIRWPMRPPMRARRRVRANISRRPTTRAWGLALLPCAGKETATRRCRVRSRRTRTSRRSAPKSVAARASTGSRFRCRCRPPVLLEQRRRESCAGLSRSRHKPSRRHQIPTGTAGGPQMLR